MRVSPIAVLVGVLAAATGWFVRGLQLEPSDTVTPSPPQVSVPSAEDPGPFPERVVRTEHISTDSSRRNLFVYPIREEPVQRAVFRPSPPPAEILPIANPAPPVDEIPRPRFPYRYIGRFGPDRNPVAAFARDGEIVTVQPGDRIDAHFVVRSIGIESVEVENTTDGQRDTQRIPMQAAHD